MIKDLLFLSECLDKIAMSRDIDIEDCKLEIADCIEDIKILNKRINTLAGAIEEGQELSPLSVLMLVKASLQDFSTGFSNLADEFRLLIVDESWEEFPERKEYESESQRERYCKVGEGVRAEWTKK